MNSSTQTIERRKSKDDENSFDSLRVEALKLSQMISGEIWTDYNVHDPGVTLLEQLIFGITELVYRTDLAVEDYLVNDNNQIDLDEQSLHSPVDSFPCRATTIIDYRKVFLDAIDDIDNVWLSTKYGQNNKAYHGLYQISVKIKQGLDEKQSREVKSKLRNTYYSHRNLGEDIDQISIVKNIDYELCGTIEIAGSRTPTSILAEIYFECAKKVSACVDVINYGEMGDKAVPLDQLFSGPLTCNGFFREVDFVENQNEFFVSTLFSIVNAIKGVNYIQELYLLKTDPATGDQQSFFDVIKTSEDNEAFDLLLPTNMPEINIGLTKNGRVIPISIDEVSVKFEELRFKYEASQSTPQDLSALYEIPTGTSRPLDNYFSIQNHFPNSYGINAYGIPSSASDSEKARAKQLSSYLVIFEQLLANFSANISSIKTYFSTKNDNKSSYAFKLLNKKQIYNLDAIYPKDPFESLKRVLQKFDNYYDRKNRFLDYLLALHGQSFTQRSLRRFNFYYDSHEIEETTVNNKIHYLKNIIEVDRDRASAPILTGDTWSVRARSGVQFRISLLLGFEQHTARSLTMATLKQGLKVTLHSLYEHLKAGSHELKYLDVEEIDNGGDTNFESITNGDNKSSVIDPQKFISEIIPLRNNLLSDELLRSGILLNRYKTGSLTENKDYQLICEINEKQYWYLGTFKNRELAAKAGRNLRQLLLLLNRQSEGLHVIEHILLRPNTHSDNANLSASNLTDQHITASKGNAPHSETNRSKENKPKEEEKVEEKVEEDFYSLRISVVFPSWTARCHNNEFKKLAEETVQLNMPAHLYADVIWLDFQEMYEFEDLYESWMTLKSEDAPNLILLDEYSSQIVDFLKKKTSHD